MVKQVFESYGLFNLLNLGLLKETVDLRDRNAMSTLELLIIANYLYILSGNTKISGHWLWLDKLECVKITNLDVRSLHLLGQYGLFIDEGNIFSKQSTVEYQLFSF